ncbi:MAG: hypothetical protein LBC56_04050 [Oscillospiraceae bacterium]|jgi:hypothetical protein|nr:hypothetical protein [Oscillospiraceae bacterium]
MRRLGYKIQEEVWRLSSLLKKAVAFIAVIAVLIFMVVLAVKMDLWFAAAGISALAFAGIICGMSLLLFANKKQNLEVNKNQT